MNAPRVREAGDAALLLELEERIDPDVHARVVAIADAVRSAAIAGVRDVVTTYRSVAAHFDPLTTDVEALRAALRHAHVVPAVARVPARTRDVPVVYGGVSGPDLGEVAAFARLDPEAVIERHSAPAYRVYMLGFLPGFAYLGVVDPRIAAPRRATPRSRVPAGSVGIAGAQTGIYPCPSPGGWQIIGHTPLAVFDAARTPAALFEPGDVVRFVRVEPSEVEPGATSWARDAVQADARRPGARSVTVLRPGLLTTVQDGGRWGHQAAGVSVSGALDPVSHRIANALVGNGRMHATLEVTVLGPELRIEQPVAVAVAGADLGAALDGAALPLNCAAVCRAGSVLRFTTRRHGARAYVAFDGGIDVPPVLGSRATHVASALGGVEGRALVAGDRLPLGPPEGPPARRPVDVAAAVPAGGARLRVVPGPQDDRFAPGALDLLQRARFTIGAQSDRMGYRLEGARVPRLEYREMISDATFPGAIQIPGSGSPILLMADRQTTGGYPQIATVITADLPRAAQLAPGDWVEFEVCSRAEALVALVALEGKLLAIA